jgi:hypothetical protein
MVPSFFSPRLHEQRKDCDKGHEFEGKCSPNLAAHRQHVRMRHMKLRSAACVLFTSTILSACGGGGDSAPQTAPLTLHVTDAPIDPTQIEAVCIRFTRITVHYAGQNEVTLDYNPLPSQVRPETHCMTGSVWTGQGPVPPVRLNALGGPLTVALAESLQIPVGRVTWVRLHFATGSYVLEATGGQQNLLCPSCEPTDNNAGRGFKLNRTFEVEAGGLALTVDIDLLKSLHEESSDYVLRPTARIENTAALGTIAGTVHEDLVDTSYDGTTIETGCAVYVFEGANAPVDDHHPTSTVLSSARVRYSTALGSYGYAAGALPGGTVAQPLQYTVALTCDSDEPTTDDTTDVTFTPALNADVIAGQTTLVGFAP